MARSYSRHFFEHIFDFTNDISEVFIVSPITSTVNSIDPFHKIVLFIQRTTYYQVVYHRSLIMAYIYGGCKETLLITLDDSTILSAF